MDDGSATIATIREILARVPEARSSLAELLDVLDRRAAAPARVTVAATAVAASALAEILSPRAVVAVGAGKVRIDLAVARRARPDVDAILYAALDRTRRDRRGEEDALSRSLVSALAAIPSPAHPAAAELLASERIAAAERRGETWNVACDRGPDVAAAVVADVTRALAAALELEGPLRVANFAARVLGDSKALAAGGERARRLAEAAIAHVPAIAADALSGQPHSWAAVERAAFDSLGLLRDDAAITVHCAGPLVYAKRDEIFDHVRRHAALGDIATLTLQQLRGASVVSLDADVITVIENQTPFLDYVERTDLRRELVILARGQASWATVTLLRLCAGRAPVRLAADLDRSGVLILRSLARRARIAIEPWHTDASTHRRFRDLAQPCTDEERARVARLAATDDPAAPAHDLLVELATTGVWIEQERFSHLTLLRTTDHPDSRTKPI